MARKRGRKGRETTTTPGGLWRVAVLLDAYDREESQLAIIREALDFYLYSNG